MALKITVHESRQMAEMATVVRSIDMHILIQVNSDEHHIGNPYFKVYDSFSYEKSTRMNRISFLEPAYVKHTTYGKKLWVLNAKDMKHLITILNTPSDHIDRRDTSRTYTNWEWAIIQYNNEICAVGEKDTVEGKLNGSALTIGLPMPNYMELRV
ncbi:MAG: hypothetical protein HUK21_01920 [Fibrobacteraceae bacterium]|mgnify:CR=1 FL=1|nr:hypothetical protein [Fibrobacteraceae bacterium]